MAFVEIDPQHHNDNSSNFRRCSCKNLEATLIFVDFSKAFDSRYIGKMEQILLAYDLPKETVAVIMMLYKRTKVKARSPEGDTDFDIVANVLQEDTLAPYQFIICLVLQMLIDLMKENGLTLEKARRRRYSARIVTDADYVDDITLLASTPAQVE